MQSTFFRKAFLLCIVVFAGLYSFAADSLLTQKKVLAEMEKVADWQLNSWKIHGSGHAKWDWTNAAGYTGIFALGNISKNKMYHNALIETGDSLNWEIGPKHFFADDYCIGQTYSLLYMKTKQKKMIANFKSVADSIVMMPHDESLEWKNNIQLREWAWCDALFMGPPALAYLSSATGDKKYLNMAAKLWWKTTDYLYDSTEQLYYRDGSFLNKKEKNGQKMFWSRGNGWVLAGLVRVLENMPTDYPGRKRFVDLYKAMSKKIASLQQPDGTWHASLLDPGSYPVKETSGTGFYTYALLWGLNHHLLDNKTYWPVVNSAWHALVACVHEDGMLGYVQPIGAAPDKVDSNSTEIYGVGAFLLTGSELYKFLNNNKNINE
ncbi:MAG: glycoside hydrolase family 88 protein [Ginsengibacter sp.]